MGRCSFTASTAAEPAPHEIPIEVREKELSGSETLERLGDWGERGESTALRAMPEEKEGNGGFGNNEVSFSPLVDSGAFEHYLDDLRGLWERIFDNMRLEEPRMTTTARNNKLKAIATGIISGYTINRTRARQHVRPPLVVVHDVGRNLFIRPQRSRDLQQSCLWRSRGSRPTIPPPATEKGWVPRPLHVQHQARVSRIGTACGGKRGPTAPSHLPHQRQKSGYSQQNRCKRHALHQGSMALRRLRHRQDDSAMSLQET